MEPARGIGPQAAHATVGLRPDWLRSMLDSINITSQSTLRQFSTAGEIIKSSQSGKSAPEGMSDLNRMLGQLVQELGELQIGWESTGLTPRPTKDLVKHEFSNEERVETPRLDVNWHPVNHARFTAGNHNVPSTATKADTCLHCMSWPDSRQPISQLGTPLDPRPLYSAPQLTGHNVALSLVERLGLAEIQRLQHDLQQLASENYALKKENYDLSQEIKSAKDTSTNLLGHVMAVNMHNEDHERFQAEQAAFHERENDFKEMLRRAMKEVEIARTSMDMPSSFITTSVEIETVSAQLPEIASARNDGEEGDVMTVGKSSPLADPEGCHSSPNIRIVDQMLPLDVAASPASLQSPMPTRSRLGMPGQLGQAVAEQNPKLSTTMLESLTGQGHPRPVQVVNGMSGNGTPGTHAARYVALSSTLSSPTTNTTAMNFYLSHGSTDDSSLTDEDDINSRVGLIVNWGATDVTNFQARKDTSPSVAMDLSENRSRLQIPVPIFTIPTTAQESKSQLPASQHDYSQDESHCQIGSVMDIEPDIEISEESSVTGVKQPRKTLWVPDGTSLPRQSTSSRRSVDASVSRLATARPNPFANASRNDKSQLPRTPSNVRALRRDLADEMQVFSKLSFKSVKGRQPSRKPLRKENIRTENSVAFR